MAFAISTMIDRLQIQRLELKYQVNEAAAAAGRRFVRPYLEPDGFGADPACPNSV